MTIPNVTPAYTFQNPGLGAVFQQGVAGLIHAIQIKKQLDLQEEQLAQEQKDFELRAAQQKQNQLLSQAQVASMEVNRKEKLNEFKNQQELLQKRRTALGFYNQWVGAGADFKELGKVGAQIDDPDTQEFFNAKVLENMQLQAARRQAEPPRREPTPRWAPIPGAVDDQGRPVLYNALTGETKAGAGNVSMRGGTPTEGERRAAGLFGMAQQGLDQVDTLIQNGYSPLNENLANRTARFAGADRIARAFSSEKGKLFYNGVLRIYTNALYAFSGAQIGDKEIVRQAEQQTADFLDTPTTMEQKIQFLRGTVAAVRVMAGRAAPGDEQLITPETAEYVQAVRQWNEGGRQGPMPRPVLQMTPTPQQQLQQYQQSEDWGEFMRQREALKNQGSRF